MTKKYLLALTVFVCLSINSFAQSVYSSLTDHDGYWLLYSERVEQFNNGEYLAKEVYMPENSVNAIMFDLDGQCNTISAADGFSQSESNWKLIDDKQIKLWDEKGNSALFDIMEISDKVLKLRIMEDRGNGLLMAKISTYCFPDNRLSEEEAEQKNQRGVFKIEGFTELPDKILTNEDSPYRRLSDDKEALSVYKPSENSAAIAQIVLLNSFMFDNLTELPFDVNELLTLNMVGVKRVEVTTKEEVSNLFFDKKGLLTSVKKSSGRDINIKYNKDKKNPKYISYSWNDMKTEFFMKDNWVLMYYFDSMYFYEYINESPTRFRLVKSRYFDNVTADNIETKVYNPQTKTLDIYDYFSGTNERNHITYKYVYGNDNNKYSIVELSDTYKTYDYYEIDKSPSLVTLTMGRVLQYVYDDPSGERLAKNDKEEKAKINIVLNSRGNPEVIEFYTADNSENKGKSEYNKEETISYTYQYY